MRSPPPIPDVSGALGALDMALDQLLEAREALAGLEDLAVPAMALDAALARDVEHRRCRARLDERVHAFRNLVPRELVADVLALEEAANAVSASASDVGFRLGITVARGGRVDDA